jgi:predicted transcriptional regulator
MPPATFEGELAATLQEDPGNHAAVYENKTDYTHRLTLDRQESSEALNLCAIVREAKEKEVVSITTIDVTQAEVPVLEVPAKCWLQLHPYQEPVQQAVAYFDINFGDSPLGANSSAALTYKLTLVGSMDLLDLECLVQIVKGCQFYESIQVSERQVRMRYLNGRRSILAEEEKAMNGCCTIL